MLERPDDPIGVWGLYPYLDVDLVEAQRGYPRLRWPVPYVSLELLDSREAGEGVRIVN